MYVESNRKAPVNSLQTLYTEYWPRKIITERKMRTYITFKSHFQVEDYIHIKEPKLRKAMTRLRISAHNLFIERGRYTRPPIPADQRICATCPGSKVEDEIHFMTECSVHSTEREQLYKNIIDMCPNFESLQPKQKFYVKS